MSIIAWIIVGGLAGWIGNKIMDTDGSYGLVVTIIIGIIGAFVGGALIGLLGGQGVTGINIWSILVAIFGSIVFLWIAKKLRP